MKSFVWFLQLLFFIGMVGCAITIPLCALKFFGVIFESDEEADAADDRTVDGRADGEAGFMR